MMNICRTKQQLKLAIRQAKEKGLSIGFVPTMGYLHEGHASLLREARQENDVVVLSIFVNPMQFGPTEDLDRYPRDEERDLQLAKQCRADIVFIPAVEEMYPRQPLTSVMVSQITTKLCGASRPGHFDGVGLVVSKLFHLVEPNRAYFGLKDAQQVAVIEQMVLDLDMPVTIVPCPIVREPDGLALSSRNVYLTPIQRKEATTLNKSLLAAEQLLQARQLQSTEDIISYISKEINTNTSGEIDYVEVLSFPDLQSISKQTNLTSGELEQQIIIALAVKFGSTRLIDNAVLNISEVIKHV